MTNLPRWKLDGFQAPAMIAFFDGTSRGQISIQWRHEASWHSWNGNTWFRWLDFEGRGSWSTCARVCKNLAGNWREELVLSTSFNKCACDGGQFQALRPCGGDYSSMLRLTEVQTSLISQNVHVLNCMTIDSRMTLLSMVITDGDICNSRTIADQLQFFGVMASPR